MKHAALAFLFLLAACASSAPMPAEAGAAPTSADIAYAVGASPADVQGLSCFPIEDGCHQCNFTLIRHGAEGAASEARVDMVCNISGGWTSRPLSQVGS